MAAAKVVTPKLVMAGLLSAFVFAITVFLRVPIPKSSGYLNLGDIIIVFAGLFLGPVYGGMVGGIGSALADAVGYPIFVIPTLIIKGLEGVLAGSISRKGFRWVGVLVGVAEMVAGYYLAEALVFAGQIGKAAAVTELPFNALQGLVGAIGGYLLYKIVNRLTSADEDPHE